MRLIVALSYDKGVIACYSYQKMAGYFLASFMEEHFVEMFPLADKGEEDLVVQDNCPCQNSTLAKVAMTRSHANLLNFPARCADVLCHKSLFWVVSQKLKKQVTEHQIARELYSEFKVQNINTFYSGQWGPLISSFPPCLSVF